MILIQTLELAQDFSPIYVTTDICNSFQYIKNTHTSLPNESDMHVLMIIVWQSRRVEIMVLDSLVVFYSQSSQWCKNIAVKFNHHRYRQTDRQTDRRNCHPNSQMWSNNIWLKKTKSHYRNMHCPPNNDLCFYIYFYTWYSYHIKTIVASYL